MKSSLVLTVAGAFYALMGVAGFFMSGGYDYVAYGGSILALALGILFLLTRNAPASQTRNAIFTAAWLATLGVALNALYGQFAGTYMDTATGYIPGLAMLALAVWFFLAARANMSAS